MSSARVRIEPCLLRPRRIGRRRVPRSHPPAARLPAMFQIVDQLWIVETKSLLTRICRNVAAINRQRLLADAQRLAIAHGACEPGAYHLRRVGLDRVVHLLVSNGLVADHLAFRRVGHEFALEKNALARKLDADKAGEAKVGASRNEALFAGRKIKVAAVHRHNAVHHAQELTAAADSVRLDRRQPRFFDVILELFAVGVGTPVATVDLVELAKFALENKVGKSNLPVVEMCEVDAGIENTAAIIFRMIDGAAAQDANFDSIVEQREVDRDFEIRCRAVAFGIEKGWVAERHMARMALALNARFAQFDDAVLLKLVEFFQRLTPGLEHGVDQVQPAFRIGENVRYEKPLIDLEAFLGTLQLKGSFAVNALARGHQTGKTVGDGKQIADAQCPGALIGCGVVDRPDMPAQKLFLDEARPHLDVLRVPLGVSASGRRRAQRTQRRIGVFEILRGSVAVGSQRGPEINLAHNILDCDVHQRSPNRPLSRLFGITVFYKTKAVNCAKKAA